MSKFDYPKKGGGEETGLGTDKFEANLVKPWQEQIIDTGGRVADLISKFEGGDRGLRGDLKVRVRDEVQGVEVPQDKQGGESF